MADKKKVTTAAKPAIEKEDVADAANKIWKAGLGALRTAEEEGSKFFKSLMDKGDSFQDLSRKESQRQIDKVGKIIKGGVGSVKGKLDDITDQRDRLWEVLKLEDVVTSVLKTFGVATNKEIDNLKKKIDAISKTVNEMRDATKSHVKK